MKKLLRRLKKFPSRLWRACLLKLEHLHTGVYMKCYLKWLKKQGVHVNGTPNYISNSVYFDGHDYSVISLGDGCTISREVMFLTHDYAMHTILAGAELSEDDAAVLEAQDKKDKLLVLREIVVEDHCFIGARASLLPGTHIGRNSIIGAGAVVKGNVPEGSIVIGNPAKIIGRTDEWLHKQAEKLEQKGE